MTDFVLLLLATFWAWETFRALMETFVPRVFALTRPAHPLLAAVLPLVVLWPQWIAALAVAGACGLMVAFTDRLFSSQTVTPIPMQRRRSRQDLPPLP